ncbi:MAG: hypothetical protein R6V33_01270 [Pelovirga sp.]
MAKNLMQTFLRSMFPALFLLLLIGLPSAYSCQVPAQSQSAAEVIQVNACHFDAGKTDHTHVCCDSAVCHRNSAPLRHLGSPEYANQIKDLRPLILESRQPTPSPKTASTIEQQPIECCSDPLVVVTSQAPFLALTSLRTTVLLH